VVKARGKTGAGATVFAADVERESDVSIVKAPKSKNDMDRASRVRVSETLIAEIKISAILD